MRILRASDRALLAEADDLHQAMRAAIAWEGVPGVVELVPGARTVLVRFDPSMVTAAELSRVLASTIDADARTAPAREVTIPVRYDGDDLDGLAALLGVSADEIVARHLSAVWRVAFSGFSPGFGYAVASEPLFDVPRRSSPRTRVPAGSVGLAGTFTGVYPRESPGGWQLIGRTDAVMWDIDRDPPALLAPGTVVRFEGAARARVVAAAAHARPEAPGRERAPQGPRIEVVRPFLQLLVQDVGRPGHAALGVSASGAADRTALRAANRAVGNEPDAAVLEGVGGGVLRFHGDGVAAVAGAVGDLTLTGLDTTTRPVTPGVPFAIVDGDELTLASPVRGIRYVIGVRGGVRCPRALGSAASDTLAELGPRPLVVGDRVPLADPRTAPYPVEPAPVPRALPAPGETVELAITLGPRDDWFTPAALEALTGQEWEVTAHADRIGIRLRGERPLERRFAGELPSEGAVTGALQVPPEGQPVLFLPDHPLTGGYPVIGAVTDACLDLAGQLPPGCRIRLRVEAGREIGA